MADRRVQFDIIANDRASATLDKVGGKFGKLGNFGAQAGKAVALGIGGAAVGGVVAFGAAMVQGVKDAASYQTLAAKTTAVLKSTGNAAGTSVKHIQTLAGSLETMSGVDEELIINSQNVLATFTGIQNKVGKGNDIFDQATKTALDMSSALGTDLQGASIQVGKALNDPVKGISALSKVGVSFTQQQKDQIKALAESGDKMGAQKLILAELNKEFGGAAKAAGSGFSGALARLKDAAGDTFRSLGEKLLPLLTRFMNWVTEKAIPNAVKFGQWLGPKLKEAWGKAEPALHALWNAGKKLIGWFTESYLPAFKNITEKVMPMFKFALDQIKKAFHSTGDGGSGFAGVMKFVGSIIVKSMQAGIVMVAAFAVAIGVSFRVVRTVIDKVLWPAFRALVKGLLGFLGTILDAAATAFGWIPGIGPKLRTAQAKFRTFRDSVNNSLAGIHDKTINIKVRGADGKINNRASKNANQAADNAGRAIGGGVLSGLTYRVNEMGQELLKINDQSMSVIPHAQSQRMLRQSGGSGGGDVHIHIHGSVLAERDALTFIDKAKRRASLSGAYVTA